MFGAKSFSIRAKRKIQVQQQEDEEDTKEDIPKEPKGKVVKKGELEI